MSLIAVSVWALPHAARACSCILPPPPATAAERAEAVFEARVDGVQGNQDPRGAGMVRYDLAVARVFKGDVGSAATVVTRSSSAACGRNFTVGKRYLIYAYRTEDGELGDTMCSRTRLISAADEDLAVLGPGAAPSAPTGQGNAESREPPRIEPPPALPASPTPAANRGCQVGAPAPAGLVGLVITGLALRRRRRRPDT